MRSGNNASSPRWKSVTVSCKYLERGTQNNRVTGFKAIITKSVQHMIGLFPSPYLRRRDQHRVRYQIHVPTSVAIADRNILQLLIMGTNIGIVDQSRSGARYGPPDCVEMRVNFSRCARFLDGAGFKRVPKGGLIVRAPVSLTDYLDG